MNQRPPQRSSLRSKPHRAAITGGAASGKSTVLAMFAKLGADCFSADEISRDLTGPGSSFVERLAKIAGPKMQRKDGSLNRQELARILFGDTEVRRAVEAVLHPAVIKGLREAARQGSAPVQCFEIPLLVEAGLQDEYDTVILCRCGERERLRRLVQRLAGDKMLARRIVNTQAKDTERMPFADWVIRTDRPMEAVERRVSRIWAYLLKRSSVCTDG